MPFKAGHIILFTDERESMNMALDYFRRESYNQEVINKGHGGCYD
jgi:hypothetical protein